MRINSFLVSIIHLLNKINFINSPNSRKLRANLNAIIADINDNFKILGNKQSEKTIDSVCAVSISGNGIEEIEEYKGVSWLHPFYLYTTKQASRNTSLLKSKNIEQKAKRQNNKINFSSFICCCLPLLAELWLSLKE